MDPELIDLASRRVPRYTSYPTAVQFTSDVGPETYAGWLGGLDADAEISVYLHVPFCQHLCFYCGCNTRAERDRGVIAAYAKSLAEEIEIVAAKLPEKCTIGHIHWGGGTPTELGSGGLGHVGDLLADRFHLSPDLEHAIELDPRRVGRDLIRELARRGVTRASLGVQTLDAAVQRAIGRVQPYEQVEAAVGWLREAGLGEISFDLMYGLPQQTVASIDTTIDKVMMLRPRRISAFGYAHVPWMKKIQGAVEPGALPGPEERLGQMMALRARLLAEGFVAVGFDHFALPDDQLARDATAGRLQRNFQGYTTDKASALIGLGASAIGRLSAGYVQNAANAEAYAKAVAEGVLPITRGRAFGPEDRVRAALIQDVLCNGSIDLQAVVPEAVGRQAMERLQPLAKKGLVDLDGQRVQLTEAGWPFARLVASAFDAYLADTPAGHSLAV